MSVALLILPGINDSGPEHWQSIWQRATTGASRVQPEDWDHPVCAAWSAALRRAVADARQAGPSRVVLVAHSLGCLQVAHAVAEDPPLGREVSGAFLVAPPDPDAPGFPVVATGFHPLPRAPLPFSSVLVASRDDPYADFEFSSRLASAWGSRFVDAGACGHLNVASGLGAWPEGRRWLEALLVGKDLDCGR